MSILKIEIPLTVEETIANLSVNQVHKITGKRSSWATKCSLVRKSHPERRFKLFELDGIEYVGRKNNKK